MACDSKDANVKGTGSSAQRKAACAMSCVVGGLGLFRLGIDCSCAAGPYCCLFLDSIVKSAFTCLDQGLSHFSEVLHGLTLKGLPRILHVYETWRPVG